MERRSYADIEKKYAQNPVMAEIQKAYLQKCGEALYYNHNGADVAIIDKAHQNRHDYEIFIMKDDKTLTFRAAGEIGNDAGTLFVGARVVGLVERKEASGKPSEGMYPYTVILKSEQKEKGVDVLVAAAKVYQRYQDETQGEIKIGDIFKSYVPGSFQSIKENLNQIDKQNQEAQKRAVIDSKIQDFADKLHGW